MTKLAYPMLCGLLAENPTTLSYAMHSGAYKALGLPHTYSCFSTTDTAGALQAMRTLGIRGLSLTIPHKESAMSLVDEVEDSAKQIGAINTVVNKGGKLVGHNTDWLGIVDAFREAGQFISGKRVVLVGAGGAAKAGLHAMKQLKASSVTVYNRNFERAQAAAKEFGFEAKELDALQKEKKIEVLINASPIGSSASGLKDQIPPICDTALSIDSIVFDMVTHRTKLTDKAESAGANVILGIRMLLFQAVEQFRLFTDREIDPKVMDKALQSELERSGLD